MWRKGAPQGLTPQIDVDEVSERLGRKIFSRKLHLQKGNRKSFENIAYLIYRVKYNNLFDKFRTLF